jgi:hypothetical protein
MSIGFYKSPNPNDLITSTNPLTFTFDGRYGGMQDKCVYVRNDNANVWYDNIVISVTDEGTEGIVDGSRPGFRWRLKEDYSTPILESWKYIADGADLHLTKDLGQTDLSDIATYLPFWVHVELPHRLEAKTITSVVLTITAQEHLV